jgi:hypothetical protein
MRLVSLLVGAGLMYFLDPSNGIRRRQWLRDQWISFRTFSFSPEQDLRDTENFQQHPEFSHPDPTLLNEDWDKALLTRVEEEVAHHVSSPGSIKVKVEDGLVTLSGRALLTEIALVMERVSTMPGVTEVKNHMKVRQETADTASVG